MNPRVKHLALPLGGALVATSMAGATLTGTATATSPASADPDAKTTTLTPSGNAKTIAGYWTPSRLKSAKTYVSDSTASGRLRKLGSAKGAADGRPGTVAPTGEGGKSAGRSKNVNLPITVGKVFFVDHKGQERWCSGTSVQSKFRNLVATAGHCVYDTDTNKPYDNFVFIPGYHQGKAPWGIYVGAKVNTHDDFTVYEDYDYDYAFVNVYDGVKQLPERLVDYKAYKAHVDKGGMGREEVRAVDRATYDEWTKKGGLGKVEGVDSSDQVGPQYKGAVAVAVETTKDAWSRVPGRVYGLKDDKVTFRGATLDQARWPRSGSKLETRVEHVTKAEYDAYKGPGHKHVDARGNYLVTHYSVVKYIAKTSTAKYFVFRHYVTEVAHIGRLGDNVGGQGFSWNQKLGKKVFTFGYPSYAHLDGNRPYSGHTMKWCYGKTSAAPVVAKYNAQEHQAVRCAFTPGASGGPFLLQYKNSKRTGYLNGVVSLTLDSDGNDRYDQVTTPYFNGETYGIYRHAANLWTGRLPR
ncbi:trypsin-like serine peptidase [Planomonospora corallina]|uniref:Trypsin-like serine peptidase n=1 Tax=Planomonospora corallina TaxID=1806052 RepID=A0ABV8IBZ5_9ACTN